MEKRESPPPRGRSSPVRPLSELLLQGPDDDPLHPLVGLGDQIHGRALGLDLDLALPGFPDLLNESRWEQNVQGNPLPPWNPDFTHLSGDSCHLDGEVVGLLPGIFHFLHRLGANWENVSRRTNRKRQAEGVRAPTDTELLAKLGLRNDAIVARSSEALLHITSEAEHRAVTITKGETAEVGVVPAAHGPAHLSGQTNSPKNKISSLRIAIITAFVSFPPLLLLEEAAIYSH